MLADDSKYHPIMRESLKIVQQSASTAANCESQKKLSILDKVNQGSMKNVSLHSSIKPNDKKITLKEEIFEYLNCKLFVTAVDNLKISNPNDNKSKAKDKQADHEEEQSTLKEALKKNQ
jgi:hypothetical protein